MKKRAFAAALTAGILAGILRAADLFLNTAPETGFLISGNIWLRYMLLAAALIPAWIGGQCAAQDQQCALGPEAAIWKKGGNLLLALISVSGTVYSFRLIRNAHVRPQGHHWDAARLQLKTAVSFLQAALFALLAVWCLVLLIQNIRGKARSQRMLVLGTAASSALYLGTIVRFAQRPSSLHRFAPAAEILSSLAALVFTVALLRALYLPEKAGTARMLFRCGMTAFVLCTCLLIPQTICSLSGRLQPDVPAELLILHHCIGLLGAVCAAGIPAEQSGKAA